MFSTIKIAVALLIFASTVVGQSTPSSTPGAETDLKRVEYVDMYRGRYRLTF